MCPDLGHTGQSPLTQACRFTSPKKGFWAGFGTSLGFCPQLCQASSSREVQFCINQVLQPQRMVRAEDTVNLCWKYEERALGGGCEAASVVPAVIITGFLGSGKTTLVEHLLRSTR